MSFFKNIANKLFIQKKVNDGVTICNAIMTYIVKFYSALILDPKTVAAQVEKFYDKNQDILDQLIPLIQQAGELVKKLDIAEQKEFIKTVAKNIETTVDEYKTELRDAIENVKQDFDSQDQE